MDSKETKRITPVIPTGSGNRTGWVKRATAVDRSQKGGYAVEGEFLNAVQVDLEIGEVIVRCTPAGSARKGYKQYDLGFVTSDGIVYDSQDYTTKNWLSFLDDLEQRLEKRNATSETSPEEKLSAAISEVLGVNATPEQCQKILEIIG